MQTAGAGAAASVDLACAVTRALIFNEIRRRIARLEGANKRDANLVMCKRPASGPSPAKKAKKAKTAYELWKKEQPEYVQMQNSADPWTDGATVNADMENSCSVTNGEKIKASTVILYCWVGFSAIKAKVCIISE